MPIDVPVQVVDAPVVSNQVYVIPGVNWDIGRTRIADGIEIADDPDHFYSLDMEDVPDFVPGESSEEKAALDTIVKHKPVKKKVLVKRKYSKKSKPDAPKACNCP